MNTSLNTKKAMWSRGRMIEVSEEHARVELGEGIQANVPHERGASAEKKCAGRT